MNTKHADEKPEEVRLTRTGLLSERRESRVSVRGRYLTAARLQEIEWKLSALQALCSLSLCQFIQPKGDIINLLHRSVLGDVATTSGENQSVNTQLHLRFFDVILRRVFVDS